MNSPVYRYSLNFVTDSSWHSSSSADKLPTSAPLLLIITHLWKPCLIAHVVAFPRVWPPWWKNSRSILDFIWTTVTSVCWIQLDTVIYHHARPKLLNYNSFHWLPFFTDENEISLALWAYNRRKTAITTKSRPAKTYILASESTEELVDQNVMTFTRLTDTKTGMLAARLFETPIQQTGTLHTQHIQRQSIKSK